VAEACLTLTSRGEPQTELFDDFAFRSEMQKKVQFEKDMQ